MTLQYDQLMSYSKELHMDGYLDGYLLLGKHKLLSGVSKKQYFLNLMTCIDEKDKIQRVIY